VSAGGDVRGIRTGHPLLDALRANDLGSPDAVQIDGAGRIAVVSRYWAPPPLGERLLVAPIEVDGSVPWLFHQPRSEIWDWLVEPWLVTATAFDHQGRIWAGGWFGELDLLGQHLVPRGPADAFVVRLE
jgi:hypothetical protein